MRTFIAIELPESLRARIEKQAAAIRKYAPRARWVRPDSYHLTLCFLGEVSDSRVTKVSEATASVVTRHRALSLRARGGGVFGAMSRPTVLWVGLEGDLDVLAALQSDLSEALDALGHDPEYDRFEPHITLARSSHPMGDLELGRCADALAGMEVEPLEVSELAVFESENSPGGMTYRILSRHPLQLQPERRERQARTLTPPR